MTGPSPAWRRTAPLALLASAMVIAAFWPTVYTMARIWIDIGDYSHGFLILPLSLWLIWRKRHELAVLTPRAAPIVVLLFAGAAVTWLLAHLLGVQVVEQLAFIGAWITAVWAIIGHAATRLLAFPLLFLFLMVPMGTPLIPPLMEFTADFTVAMLELTGIPVYREGLHFVLPSGSWSVVAACSGVRYLIASVTLGLLFAYLNYHSLWRRAAFMALAVAIPIIANGLRAYMIVMIGHLSDMELAVGIDHLIYGWLFFGLVMLLLFWIGGLFAEPELAPDVTSSSRGGAQRQGMVGLLATLALLAVFSISARATAMHLQAPLDRDARLTLPAVAGGWQRLEQTSLQWPYAMVGASRTVQASYQRQGGQVTVVLGLYPQQRQGAEVVNAGNVVLKGGDQPWRITGRGRVGLGAGDATLHATRYQLTEYAGGLLADPGQRLMVARWYRLGGRDTADEYVAKLYQALALLEGRTDGVLVMLATPADAGAEERLSGFARQGLPQLWRAWEQSLGIR